MLTLKKDVRKLLGYSSLYIERQVLVCYRVHTHTPTDRPTDRQTDRRKSTINRNYNNNYGRKGPFLMLQVQLREKCHTF